MGHQKNNALMKIFLYLSACLLSFACMAQPAAKVDKVYLSDGRVLEVKVTKVTANIIEYTYPGETVANEEKVNNIRTIVYGSGRVQQFNTATGDVAPGSPNANVSTAPQENAIMDVRPITPNEMAILPVVFIDKLNGTLSEENSKLAQAQIYDFFQDNMSHITPIQVQDTRNTNNYLRKAGMMNMAALDEIAIEDLQKALGVEYLIISKVSYTVNIKQNNNQTTVARTQDRSNGKSGVVSSSSSSSEDVTYTYNVILDIYKGSQKIYSETREPFLTMEESWKDAYQYMLKRTPIYRRK